MEEKWRKLDIAIFAIAGLAIIFLFVTAFCMMLDGTFGTL